MNDYMLSKILDTFPDHEIVEFKENDNIYSIKLKKIVYSGPDNDLIKLLENYPNKNWQWNELSRNPNIDWQYIRANVHIPWDWIHISENPNITWEIIKNNPLYNWYWFNVSRNPSITWETIENNMNLSNKNFIGFPAWSKAGIRQNPNISWEIIFNNMEFIDENPDNNPIIPYYNSNLDDYVRDTSNLTLNIIRNNPAYRWNMPHILKNPNILKDYCSQNSSIEFSLRNFIQEIAKLKMHHRIYNYESISYNDALTWEIIQANPVIYGGVNWKWDHISSNPNITWEIIQSDLNIPWNKNVVLENPNITWEIIEENIYIFENKMASKKLSLPNFSVNPNLTYEIVINNPKIKWNWVDISRNKFKKHPVIIDKQRKIFYNILESIFM